MECVLNPDREAISDEICDSDEPGSCDQRSGNVSSQLVEVAATGDFVPAYYDSATETVYLSRYSDGTVAAVHVLDGIPAALSDKVIVGFVRDNRFYTREQAAEILQEQ